MRRYPASTVGNQLAVAEMSIPLLDTNSGGDARWFDSRPEWLWLTGNNSGIFFGPSLKQGI
jgi:hypothetical protein